MLINALDFDSSSLASNAAVELDLLINGEPTDLKAVRQLAERLGQSLDKPTPDQSARGLHVDTETGMVLAQAFTRAGGADPATSLGELFRRTEQIAEQLSSTKAATKRESLESSRAFCLALSQSTAAYRQLIFDVRPPHPYRR
ncbi:MAG TPA: hypothetical protein VND64_15775 [Pirellulales bacterium]|nr:hypothetical protein [Pirellulales bacterium]